MHLHNTDFLQAAITSPTLPISNFKAYRDLSFASFWIAVGPVFADVVPPMLGEILATSHGVVLDIGPGSGDQVFRFSSKDNITMIYGVEPGVNLHHALRENAKKAGLGEKYKVLSCGAEPDSLIPILKKEGLFSKDGSIGGGMFDEIVCIRVLCSVPKPNETVEVLYRCLKPGGRFVICEHVVNESNKEGNKAGRFFHKEGSKVGHLLQFFYTALGWEFFVGCHLLRDTTATLVNAAKSDHGWAEVNLELFDEWSVLPHVVGYCVKKL
jgi:SAM-dependent methyltransferase